MKGFVRDVHIPSCLLWVAAGLYVSLCSRLSVESRFKLDTSQYGRKGVVDRVSCRLVLAIYLRSALT